jgi:hypothetical protein
MGRLRDRMEQDLILKQLARSTRRNYLLYCRKFAVHYGRSPEELGETEVREYLLHLIQVEQVSYATYRQIVAALKFLYTVTLGQPGVVDRRSERHRIRLHSHSGPIRMPYTSNFTLGSLRKQRTKGKSDDLMSNRHRGHLQEMSGIFSLPPEGCHRRLPEARRKANQTASGQR